MDASEAVTLSSYWRLIRTNRNFRLLWLAQIVSENGDWLYAVSIYSLLLETTGSAKSVALAFVLQVLPQFFVSPTAGVINDRMSRKRVMLFADWMRAGIVLCMVLVRTRQMVWLLYVLLFAESLLWALFEPGRSAVIPNITEGSETLAANALSSTTWSFNFAVGSAIGGLMASFLGRDAVFVVNALSFVLSAMFIRRMRFTEPHLADLPKLRARDLADFTPVAEGARYVARDSRLMATLFVKCGLGLMGANWVLLPIFGERIFPVHLRGFDPRSSGMLGMSLLMAARGLGALHGAFFAGSWVHGSARRLRLCILFGFLAGSAGYFSLSAAPSLLLACACLVLAHAGGSAVWTCSTTLLQQQTEDKFRGRVFSAEGAFTTLMLAVVSYSAGILFDLGWSARALAAATGTIMLLPALAWSFALRLWKRQAVL